VERADVAMYRAKEAGRNSVHFYKAEMNALAMSRLRMESDLRGALQANEFVLHYQPQMDLKSGRIVGVEALLRWQHPERGAIGPAVFIPIAERSGLINELGNWVIDEACRQMKDWEAQGVRMRVAINLSVHQLAQPDLPERIEQALGRHALEASQLLCEITESVAMQDIQATQRAFDGLSRIGVFLSIDDFGTG
jgi:EAL domain-containing protein (putative c-di-GMP-specific phosphodiesterase class I)